MTKIVKAAGRFGVRYGQSVKRRIAKIEERQRKKQACIFCGGLAKRLAKGIWHCQRCDKKFAGHTYYLEKEFVRQEKPYMAKVLKEEKPSVVEQNKSKKKSK